MAQCDTGRTTVEKVMRDPDFRRGFAEYRAGKAPDFDKERREDWAYERGRQFAAIAPRDMVIVLPRKRQLNPKAVKLFEWSIAFRDILP